MKGNDIFLGLNDIGEDLIEKAEYGTFTQSKKKNHLRIRRPLVLAAVIALTLLLVGCAVVYMLSMKQIRIGEQQSFRNSFEYDPQTGNAVAYLGQEEVTEQVLTLAGLKGSPNYRAAKEWFAFKQEYDPDHTIADAVYQNGSIPEFPEEYGGYNLYTQEMKEKLDEILAKYDLKLIGRTIPFRTEEMVLQALGLEHILVSGSDAVMKLDYAGYQECGNLNMDFGITLPADGQDGQIKTQCHIFYMRKDAFTEDVISIEEIESWKEWNYTTASGMDVLIFRSPSDWRGFMLCDMPKYTVTVRFAFIDQQYSTDLFGNTTLEQEFMTDRQIERLADAIDFSIEPQLVEGWEKLEIQAAGSGEEIDGFSIALRSVESDGNNACITLRITAPEHVNLLEYDGYPVSLKQSNRWGFFQPAGEENGNVSGGYGVEDDGDGKSNTQNVVLRYAAGSDMVRDGEVPFTAGKVWRIYWQDLYASYLDEKTDEAKEVLLAEGSWCIDVTFEDTVLQEIELIQEPILYKASYGWDLQGNDVYEDFYITSFLLRPMSASIICDMEYAAPDFLTAGDRCAYAVMKDGSRIKLYSDSAGSGVQNLRSEAVIDLKQLDHVLMPDGTMLAVPEA